MMKMHAKQIYRAIRSAAGKNNAKTRRFLSESDMKIFGRRVVADTLGTVRVPAGIGAAIDRISAAVAMTQRRGTQKPVADLTVRLKRHVKAKILGVRNGALKMPKTSDTLKRDPSSQAEIINP